MKIRTNYKIPMFFGWYAIGSNNHKRDSFSLKLDNFTSKDLDYLYKK